MNEEIKRQWVTALRSGEYKQGRAYLSSSTGDQRTYCCLGVLCELAVKDNVIPQPELTDGEVYVYGDNDERSDIGVGTLPYLVAEWAGVNSVNPKAKDNTLSARNDEGVSFSEIADLIEEQL